MGDEKARLGLSFMYNAPGSLKDQKPADENKQSNEEKFEWRKNAPREEWAKGNENVNDQPFGIEVRNVRCLKCKRWGHVNTDKSCPLYGKSRLDTDIEVNTEIDGKQLAEDMKSQGLVLKPSLASLTTETELHKHQEIDTDEQNTEVTIDMLRALSKKEKKIILKRLVRLQKKIKKSIK